MPNSEKPTIVIVQGAFQLPEAYFKLRDALIVRGFSVVHPVLPSLTEPDLASKDLIDDALAIRSAVTRLVEYENRRVIVLMHSYGGLVGSEAVTEYLSAAHRRSRGLAGGVLHLIYFAAFILDVGQSIINTFGVAPTTLVQPGGRMRVRDPATHIYGDLPAEEAEAWAAKTVEQSYAVHESTMTWAAYKYIKSSYIVCSNDRTFPKDLQEESGRAIGAEMTSIQSAHSPMLSQAEEFAGVVEGIVASVADPDEL